MDNIAQQMQEIGGLAKVAAMALSQMDAAQKTRALEAMAAAIRAQADGILAANARDMAAATKLSDALRDRLMLNEKRIEAMAAGVAQVAALPDPVGRELEAWDVAGNGLHIAKVAVPLGVIGMIYESRPNVTADATALCIKSGNAVILRGGSESFHSNQAIMAAMQAGMASAGVPQAAAQLVPSTDRAAVHWMLNAHGVIDVIIPRGGRSLTERVQQDARVPTFLHLDGNCHVYVDAKADAAKARAIVMNAKMRRTGICGAMESLLIDRHVAPELAKALVTDLLDAGCELRGDAAIAALDARVKPATEADWATEYLAAIASVAMVDGVDGAMAHINQYGSHHTDAIITEDKNAAQQFTRGVDSAIVLVNASTQFADGGEFGFGGEIGIATGRMHARGPVGAAQLTTYKYIITTARAEGATRAG